MNSRVAWHALLPLAEVNPPQRVREGDEEWVITGTREAPFVWDAKCPHAGMFVDPPAQAGDPVVCPAHGWCFDSHTGQGDQGHLTRLPHKVEDGYLWIEQPADTPRLRPGDLPRPAGLPVIGHLHKIPPLAFHAPMERWATTYGSSYRLTFGGKACIVLAEPQRVHHVLTHRPERFRRTSTLQDALESLATDGVFSAEGDNWRAQRKFVQGSLHLRHLPTFFPTVITCTERLLARWDAAANQGTPVDPAADLMAFTVDVTTWLVFGVDINTLGGQNSWLQDVLRPIFPEVNRRVQSPVPWWNWVKTPHQRAIDRGIQRLATWVTEQAAIARQRLADDPQRSPETLLEAMVHEDVQASDAWLLGNALTLLLTGEDTTANTVAWALHELLDAPEASEKLRQEADTRATDLPAYDDLSQLHWAKAVMEETLRVRPVAPCLFLEPIGDQVVDGLLLPGGTFLIALLRPSVVDPHHTDDPEAFRPDRWLDPDFAVALRKRRVHMPFGSGARLCPGRALAIMEIQHLLSTLFRRYTFTRVGARDDVVEQFDFTMHPVGLKVRLTRR